MLFSTFTAFRLTSRWHYPSRTWDCRLFKTVCLTVLFFMKMTCTSCMRVQRTDSR